MVSPEELWMPCPECEGDGDDGDLLFPRPCLRCHGLGWISYPDPDWDEEE